MILPGFWGKHKKKDISNHHLLVAVNGEEKSGSRFFFSGVDESQLINPTMSRLDVGEFCCVYPLWKNRLNFQSPECLAPMKILMKKLPFDSE